MKLYLAGPDVFHPDAVAIGERKTALCARYGFAALYPCDDGSPNDPGAVIYANCVAKCARRMVDCSTSRRFAGRAPMPAP